MRKRKKQKKEKEISLLRSHNRMELLAHATYSEKVACNILSSMGVKYVKQHPVFTGRQIFYADIYIPTYRLIIEIDGGYHFTQEQKRKDANRSAALRRLGYHIYRMSNRDAKVPAKIAAKIWRIRTLSLK